MSHLPKTCADCRFYQGERFLMSDPNEAVHGCEIMLYLGHAIPAYSVKKDEVSLDCPLANQLRFKTLCQECMVEDYNADLIEDRYSIRLPMFYNQNVAMTLDYIGGRLGYNKHVEEGLQRKGLFGRKPDTGYFNTTDKNGNVTNVGHQHDPIKDQEIRMEWARKNQVYTLFAEDPFFTNKVEVWRAGKSVKYFFLPDGVNLILVHDVTGEVMTYLTIGAKPESNWKTLFEVILARGKVMSWTDFQTVKEPKPTLEERVDAIERKLSLQQKY